jgi:hypothetical protein
LIFIFLFVQGDKIHASIRKQLIYMFQGKLVEGDCYKLCYFGVAPVSGSYRTTSHEYKLLFLMRTKVQKCEAPSISRFGLSLIKCADVKAHKSESVYLRGILVDFVVVIPVVYVCVITYFKNIMFLLWL